MVLSGDKTVEGLIRAAATRRRQAPVRLFVALVLALTFHGQLEFAWLWGWLAAYVGSQLFEIWALWPFRPDRPPPGPLRTAVAVLSIFMLAAVFGVIALPLWLVPDPLGPAGAVLLLSGGLLNVLGVSRGSSIAFTAAAVPYAAYLMAAPLVGRFGGNPFTGPFLLAETLFLIAAVTVFRHAERLTREQSRIARELESRRAGAVADAEAKAAMAAMISHDLRTPLGAILAATGEIQRRASDAEVRERAGLILESGRMMRALLDDLLDLSKLEAKRMRVERIPFDLQLLVEDLALFWSAEARRKGLSLTLEGAETLPTRAAGDPMRLRQILNNLLSNAVKFTDEGGIRLMAAARETAGGELVLKVCVADTGRGVKPERLSRIFQPFDQGDESTARTHGGTGLGLAISRELARLMGGDLTVESTPGAGSRFTLLATLGEATAPAVVHGAGVEAPAEPQREAAPIRILVVDDHEIGRKALSLLLGPLGAAVSTADSGARALEILALEPVDLVLMDVTMAGMDGLEACRRLRAAPGPNQRTPVLAVTGRTDEKDVEACLAAGMDVCLAKPVEAAELYDAMSRMLDAPDDRDAAAA